VEQYGALAGFELCDLAPAVLRKFSAHLQGMETPVSTSLPPESRLPPADLFG